LISSTEWEHHRDKGVKWDDKIWFKEMRGLVFGEGAFANAPLKIKKFDIIIPKKEK
jgi:hypothetical protein